MRKYLPYLALLFGITGLGFSAIFVKWANAPGAVSGFYRMSIAAAVMVIPFGLGARKAAPLSRPHVWLAVAGGLFFAADLAAWNTGVLITNAANATLMGNTSPFWVSLGALFLFKEKLRPAFWAGLALAMLGAFVILGGDYLIHPTLGWGDTLALIAGFFYGAFFFGGATRPRKTKLADRLVDFSAIERGRASYFQPGHPSTAVRLSADNLLELDRHCADHASGRLSVDQLCPRPSSGLARRPHLAGPTGAHCLPRRAVVRAILGAAPDRGRPHCAGRHLDCP